MNKSNYIKRYNEILLQQLFDAANTKAAKDLDGFEKAIELCKKNCTSSVSIDGQWKEVSRCIMEQLYNDLIKLTVAIDEGLTIDDIDLAVKTVQQLYKDLDTLRSEKETLLAIIHGMQDTTDRWRPKSDMTFETWIKKCDEIVANQLNGLSLYDLEDWNWMDAYQDGSTPSEAVELFKIERLM